MFDKKEEKINEVLGKILSSDSRFSNGYQKNSIAGIWAEVLGATISRYTTSVRIEGESLYVKISAASLRNELEFEKGKLIKKINEKLIHKEITRLIIR